MKHVHVGLGALLCVAVLGTASGQVSETNLFPGVDLPVPDGTINGVQDVRTTASQIVQLTSVRVRLKIDGDYNGDLYAYLRYNSGQTSHLAVLLNRPGRTTTNLYGYSDDGFDVVFDDEAANDVHTYRSVLTPAPGSPLTGEWQPDARFVDPTTVTTDSPRLAFLSLFNGMPATGEWTLFVADMSPGGTNYFESWGLELTGMALPQLTWSSPAALVYGAALSAQELNASADVPGTFIYNPPLGTVLGAGSGQQLTVTFLPADTNTYVTATASVTIDVAPQPATVTAWSTNKTYGQTLSFAGTEFTVAGLVNGDMVTNVTLVSAGTPATAGTGVYDIVPSAPVGTFNATNYEFSFVSGTLTVNPASLMGTAGDAFRLYGQTNPLFTVTYSGFVNGQDASVVTGTLSGSSPADTNSPVGPYPISVGGQSAPNYTIQYVDGTLTVRPTPLEVTADDASRAYGQPNPVFTATFSGWVNGEDTNVLGGALVLSCAAETNSPVGTYPIIPSGLTATNYALTFSNGTLTVTLYALTVTANNQSRTYGGTNPVLTGSIVGLEAGDNISAVYATAAQTSSAVGSYPITIALLDPDHNLNKYTVTTNNGTLGITPALLTGTADAKSRLYGASNPPFTVSYTGFVNGEGASVVTGTLSGSSPADTNSPAGQYPVSVGGQSAPNYTIQYVDGTLTVLPAPLQVTADDASRAYGQTNPAFTATFSGWVNGEDTNVLGGALALGSPAETNSPVGLYPIIPSGLTATNYSLTFSNGTLTVVPCALTITGLSAQGKVYDGNTTATVTGTAILNGVVSPDVVTVDATGAAATFASKDVGTEAVTVTGYALAGKDENNYSLSAQPVVADAVIAAKTLTVTGVTAKDKSYDGNTTATLDTTGAAVVGKVTGDDVTLIITGATGAFADANIGTGKPVTVSGLSLTGADAGNYSLTPLVLTANITSGLLTVAGIEAQNKVYDGTTNAMLIVSNAVLVGVVSGDTVTLDTTNAVGAFADKNVGTGKTVTVSGLALLGADAGKYTLTQPTTNADITAVGLSVTGVTANSKTYDGTNTASLGGTAALSVGVVGSEDVALGGSPAAAFDNKNVGTNKPVTVTGYTLVGADSGNYTLSAPAGLAADITPLAVTITGLSAQNKVYDGTISATLSGAVGLAGVLGGDVVLLGGTATGTFADANVGTGKAVGVGGLSLGGADGGNYSLMPLVLQANITPLALTITGLSAQNKVYDSTTTATLTGTAALVGVLGSDVVSLGGTATGTFADANIGAGKSVIVTGLSLTGANAGNYSLAPLVLTADIASGLLTVAGIEAQNKVYDGTTNATLILSNAVLVGAASGDRVTLDTTNAVGAFADKNVGTGKTVTVSGLTLLGVDADKYMLTQPTTNADITAVGLTVTGVTANSKTYDGTNTASLGGTAALSVGVVGSEDVALGGSPAAAFDNKNVGTNKPVTVTGYTLVGADVDNYTLAQPAGLAADITPLALTITGLSAQSKDYDASTAAALNGTPNLAGVLGSDVVSLGGTATGAFVTKNAGTGKMVTVSGLSLTGADTGNYRLTPLTLTADIRPMVVTLTGLSAQNKVYDGSTSATVTGTASLAEWVLGSDVVILYGTPLGAFVTKTAGTGKTVNVGGLSLGGADAGNYSLTPLALQANITPLALTITGLSVQNKSYDGSTSATLTGTAGLAGVLSDDVVLLSGTATGTFADAGIGGGKTVTVSGLSLTGADAGNYSLAPLVLTANITSGLLTVAGIEAQNKVYDGTTNATLIVSNAVLVGVVSGDTVTLDTTNAVGAFADKNVGTAKTVTVSGLALLGADAGKYTLTQPTTNADITPLALTITGLSALNKVYDGTTSATLNGTAGVAGVLGGDVVLLDGTATGAFADANVGTGKPVTVIGLLLTGGDAGNYSLAPLTLIGDITAASTTTVLVSSANPSVENSDVTFTATVTPGATGTTTPSGTIQFYTNGVSCGSPTPLSASVASLTLASLPSGYTVVEAAYLPDANFLSSTDNLEQLVQAIVQPPITLGIQNNNDGAVTLSFSGTPYAEYVVQVSDSLAATTWENISTNVAGADGKWTFEDSTDGHTQRYYRSAKP